MKLIEVIAGVNTPAETVEAIKKIAVEIGKTPVQVNEAAGFVVNRILIPMINEAAFHQDGRCIRYRWYRCSYEAWRKLSNGTSRVR